MKRPNEMNPVLDTPEKKFGRADAAGVKTTFGDQQRLIDQQLNARTLEGASPHVREHRPERHQYNLNTIKLPPKQDLYGSMDAEANR